MTATIIGAMADSSARQTAKYRRARSYFSASSRMDSDDGGLVAIGLGIHAGSTECLGPIRGETLDILGMETVAERMADYFVGHRPTMPGSGKIVRMAP